MPPPPGMQRFAANPNSMPNHYQQYPPHSQAHGAGLPPPSLNPPFMNNAHNPILNVFNMNGIPGNSGGGFGGGGLGAGGGVGLASQAAQMGFHSATTSQQQQPHAGMTEHSGRTAQHKGRIREVWKSNLHEEIEVIRNMVEKFPYVSLVSPKSRWLCTLQYEF